jgi:TPP-dependent pyruvate/acetoin dehydrogenase alpha subunit
MTFRSGTYSSHFGETRPGIEQDLSEWAKRDPLRRMADWLIDRGVASAQDLEELEREEERRIADAFSQVLAEKKGD